MSNYYEILQIKPSASNSEIKSSYKRLALLYHPDKNGGRIDAEEKFKHINEAYKTLSNVIKRRKYDQKIGITNPSSLNYKYHQGGLYRSMMNMPTSNPPENYTKPEVFKSKKKDIEFYLFWLTIIMILALIGFLIANF